MGAAGLVCSTSEMAYKSGTGIEIDISLVPRKEEGMNAYEVMLSESQERMLLIVKPENLEAAEAVLKKWNVDSSTIGKVTADKLLRVKEKDNLAAEVPAQFLAEGPEYSRQSKEPEYLKQTQSWNLGDIEEAKDYGTSLLKLLSSSTIASKEWIAKKVDAKLLKNSCLPISDVAVYHLGELNKAIAVTADGNGLYCYLDPLAGGQIAVVEAARNLVCHGAQPLGITDGLNFGSPHNPEVYWQFEQVVSGIARAAKALDLPVVSGNVSFNNENPKGAIYPTPIIGMVGLIEDPSWVRSPEFKNEGDLILLLGENKEELGGSQYLNIVQGLKQGLPPEIDLEKEKNLHRTVREMIKQGLALSVSDCSGGGLAVALAKSCILSQKGAEVNLSGNMRGDALLFGETQSRIIVTVSSENKDKAQEICKKFNLECSFLGEVKGTQLKINELIDLGLAELEKSYKQAIPQIVES